MGGLKDINDVEIDIKESLEEKAGKFLEDTGNLFNHKNEEYEIHVRFSDTDYTATDAMKSYLEQVAVLKY